MSAGANPRTPSPATAGAELTIPARLATLSALLAAHPRAAVATLDRGGDFVDATELFASIGLEIGDQTALQGRALVEFVVPSDAVAVNLAAAQAAHHGTATTTVLLKNGQAADVHFVDLNDSHGVRVALIVADDGNTIPQTPPIPEAASGTLVGTFHVNTGGIITTAEPSVIALLGWPADHLETRPAIALVHPDDQEAGIVNWVAAMEQRGMTIRSRCRVQRCDDTYLWVDAALTNRVDDAGDAAVRVELVDVSTEVEAIAALRRSEAQLDTLLRHSRDVVAVLDPDGTLAYISPSAPQLFGYPYGSHLGTSVFDLVHPDDRDRAIEALAQRLRTTALRDPLEIRVSHADGTWHDLELVSGNLVDDPAVRGIVLNLRDITQRKRAETLLRESERRLDTLLTTSSDVIVVTDATGVLTYISPAARHVFGFEPEAWIGRNVLDLVDPDDREQAIESLANTSVNPGPNVALELKITNATGEKRHVEVVANNLLADPTIAGIVFNVRDVTERVERVGELHRAQADLAHAARKFEAVLSNLSDLVSVIDANGNMTYLSPVAERMLGRRADDREGHAIFDYVHPDDLDHTLSTFQTALAQPGLVPPFETRVRHEDGTYRILEVSANNLLDDPAVSGIIVNSRDITDRVESARAQHKRDSRYRRIVEIANEGIWTIDAENITTFVNPRMAQMLGYTVDHMVGIELFEFLDEQGRQFTEQKLERRRSGITEHFDFQFVHADGTPVFAMLAASPLLGDDGEYLGSLALVTDVTERRRVEAALREADQQHRRHEAELERHQLETKIERSRRVEAIGQLAAGIAHDFNNLLGVIANYATVAVKHLPDGPPRDDVARILDVAQEASRLTHRLLQVGQRNDTPPEIVPLDETVAHSVQLIQPTLGDAYGITTNTDASGAQVAISAGGLEQILLNALLNARDAMPHGGTIEIRTAIVTDHAVLTIRDAGQGMPAEVLGRALEPFYSTKPPAQGTGLGLPTIKGIVERADGTLQLASTPGVGTELVVRLPLASAFAEHRVATDTYDSAQVLVLVVDDDDEFRHLTSRILQVNGYATLEAGNATDALRILDQTTLGVLLTDIRMPGVDGFALAERATLKQSDLKIVFMSGHHDQTSCAAESRVVLRKPFTEADLVSAIGGTLLNAPDDTESTKQLTTQTHTAATAYGSVNVERRPARALQDLN